MTAEAAVTYYDYVRTNIVFLVLFFFTLMFAYGFVRIFSVRTDFERRNHHSLPAYLSIFSLSIAGVTILLVPIKIMAVEFSQIYKENAVFPWILANIVSEKTWEVVFSLSLFSLFVITPFAYFYYEAMMTGSTRKFASRLSEALIMLTLSLALAIGYFYLYAVTFFSDGAISVAHFYYAISGIGSLLFLFSAPRGFFFLLTSAKGLGTRVDFKSNIQDEIECLSLQMMVLTAKKKGLSEEYFRLYKEQQDLFTLQSSAAFRRNTALVVSISSISFCFISIIFRVIFHQLNGLFDTSRLLWGPISLFFAPKSRPGEFYGARAVLDQALIFACVVASLAGYYNFLQKISCQLQIHNTGTPAIILNSGVILLISFSLPTVIHLLGLTSVDLLYELRRETQRTSIYYVFLFNILFLISILYAVYRLMTQVYPRFFNRTEKFS